MARQGCHIFQSVAHISPALKSNFVIILLALLFTALRADNGKINGGGRNLLPLKSPQIVLCSAIDLHQVVPGRQLTDIDGVTCFPGLGGK